MTSTGPSLADRLKFAGWKTRLEQILPQHSSLHRVPSVQMPKSPSILRRRHDVHWHADKYMTVP